ncbi:hypothetical protein T06_14284 [Trichinella sp. T6]|nr:hypothetical protein T06_14284 [Trichinella sp. T6]
MERRSSNPYTSIEIATQWDCCGNLVCRTITPPHFGDTEHYMAVMQSYFENGWAEKASASSTPGKSAPPPGVPAGHYGKAEMSAGDATSRLGYAPPSAVHVRQKVYSLHRPQRIEVAQELPGT